MEIKITKKETVPMEQTVPIKVLFHSWKNLPHSYGIVSAFLLIHLHLNYGPNGKIKKNAIEIYVEEAGYYNPEWKNKTRLVYNEIYNKILENLKIYNNESVDIIYSQTYPYKLGMNRNVPKVVFYTSEFAKLTSQYFDPLMSLGEIKNHINKYNKLYFTSPSEWSAKGMDEFVDRTRNRTITHGVDNSIFFKSENDKIRNEIRRFYKIKETDILMINIGAMTTNKGILLILEALNILVNKMGKTEYKLMLKGSGDLYMCQQFVENYFLQFKQKNIMTEDEINNLVNNHIIFTNKTLSFEKINDLFNSCDLYISPYLCEGFGLTMLEAITAGLPVLVPKTGSTEEYIKYIHDNHGEKFINYVDSVIVKDPNGMCQNIIKIEDLVDTIKRTERTQRTDDDYKKMISFINKELSWDYVSTLLFKYFQDILK